jgi:glycosyltransferase involved in cell wall biosynthesis
MRFLHIIGTLNPDYGGPVEALKQLTNTIQNIGHSVVIISLDEADAPRIGGLLAKVYAIGPSFGKYRYNTKIENWLVKNASNFDLITVQGIWQFQSFGTWLASKKAGFSYNVFVHGALDPWFKQAYPFKHLKKWLYWPWAEYRVLRDAKAVLFTSENEEKLAAKSFCLYKVNPIIINYGIGSPPGDPDKQKQIFFEKYPDLIGKRIIVFLSRIHPKKGCDLLIEAFSNIAHLDPNLHLVMAGPDQTGWIPDLKKQATLLKIENRITWTGMIMDDVKWGLFRSADIFILPSHSENFGVAVVESLACGLPVIITEKVNIWREIEKDGAGLVAADTVLDITRILNQWYGLDSSQKSLMNINAYSCFKRRFEIEKTAEQFIELANQNNIR